MTYALGGWLLRTNQRAEKRNLFTIDSGLLLVVTLAIRAYYEALEASKSSEYNGTNLFYGEDDHPT